MDFKEFKSKYELVKVKKIQKKHKIDPLVSVCVQTYNHEKYISKCLDSILEQQVKFNLEILIHEDDSSDRTRKICLQYAKRFPEKIRLFLNSRKNNISVAGEPTGNFPTLYNLFSAKGKYIAICEGDDFWGDPLKLQLQLDFMEAHLNYSVCYHNYKIVDSDGKIIKSDKASPIQQDLGAEQLMYPILHPATLTIFFRNLFTSFPIELPKVYTLDVFIYVLLGENGPGKYLPEIQPALYRVHDGGLWSGRTVEKKLLAKINTYQKIIEYSRRTGSTKTTILFQTRIIKLLRYLLFISLKKMNPIKVIKYLVEFLKSLAFRYI